MRWPSRRCASANWPNSSIRASRPSRTSSGCCAACGSCDRAAAAASCSTGWTMSISAGCSIRGGVTSRKRRACTRTMPARRAAGQAARARRVDEVAARCVRRCVDGLGGLCLGRGLHVVRRTRRVDLPHRRPLLSRGGRHARKASRAPARRRAPDDRRRRPADARRVRRRGHDDRGDFRGGRRSRHARLGRSRRSRRRGAPRVMARIGAGVGAALLGDRRRGAACSASSSISRARPKAGRSPAWRSPSSPAA